MSVCEQPAQEGIERAIRKAIDALDADYAEDVSHNDLSLISPHVAGVPQSGRVSPEGRSRTGESLR
jgi:hypothetical protein